MLLTISANAADVDPSLSGTTTTTRRRITTTTTVYPLSICSNTFLTFPFQLCFVFAFCLFGVTPRPINFFHSLFFYFFVAVSRHPSHVDKIRSVWAGGSLAWMLRAAKAWHLAFLFTLLRFAIKLINIIKMSKLNYHK